MTAGRRMSLFDSSFEPLNMGTNFVVVDCEIGSTKVPCKLRRCMDTWIFGNGQIRDVIMIRGNWPRRGKFRRSREVVVEVRRSTRGIRMAAISYDVPKRCLMKPQVFKGPCLVVKWIERVHRRQTLQVPALDTARNQVIDIFPRNQYS